MDIYFTDTKNREVHVSDHELSYQNHNVHSESTLYLVTTIFDDEPVAAVEVCTSEEPLVSITTTKETARQLSIIAN